MHRGRAVAPLMPAPFRIGLNAHYANHQQEVVLRCSEQWATFSGDDFSICDVYNNLQFRVDAKAFSFRNQRDIYDAYGRPQYTIFKRILSLMDTYEGCQFQIQDARLFKVKQQFHFGGTRLTVTFPNMAHDGRETTFELRGSFFERSAEILWNGQVVARISRDFFNGSQIFFDASTYYVAVAPGIDTSLVLGIVICLSATDEKKR